MQRRATISLKRGHALTLTRVSVGNAKLVYVILADLKLAYPKGRSRIAYIGTTKNGVSRVAGSAASRAADLLGRRGIHALEARIVTTRPRQNVKSWKKLERGLLLAFKERFGLAPISNTQGRRMKVVDEYEYFSRARLQRVIEELS